MSDSKRVILGASAIFSLLILFFATPVRGQVRWWRDKNGILHIEGTNPARAEAQGKELPPNTSKMIDRKHAGLTLGDDESAFKAAGKGIFTGKSGVDGNYYQYTTNLPPGAVSGGALFVTGRLALILLEYTDTALGGWDGLIKQTTQRYGAPFGDSRSVAWSDGATTLSFTRESNGNITCIVDDTPVMAKEMEAQKVAAPKF